MDSTAHLQIPLGPVLMLIWMCGSNAMSDSAVLCNWNPSPGLDWGDKCSSESPVCTFEGVTCYLNDIIEIDISERTTLSGTLSEDINHLNDLEIL